MTLFVELTDSDDGEKVTIRVDTIDRIRSNSNSEGGASLRLNDGKTMKVLENYETVVGRLHKVSFLQEPNDGG